MQAENADGIREQVARDIGKLDHRLSDVENKMKQHSDALDHKLQSVSLPCSLSSSIFHISSLFLSFIPSLSYLSILLP